MPDISQINLPNDNTTYDIADLVARGLIWQGTQTQYDAITTKDPSIVYFITDATGTSLAAVAMSGNYADLTNKPVIDTSLDTTSSNAIANGPVASFAESISSTVSNKMDKANPTGTGSLSLNRSGATGTESVSIGHNCVASGTYSYAEGMGTTSSGNTSHAEGYQTTSSGFYTHAEGWQTTASGTESHAENEATTASGDFSHAEGNNTIAQRRSQHVFGEYNLADTGGTGVTTKGTYVEIVGKGTSDASRSNARTLDWSGNEVLAGGLKVNGSQDVAVVANIDIKLVSITLANTGSLAGGASKLYEIDASDYLPSGYTPLCVVPYTPGDDQFVFQTCAYNPTQSKIYVTIRNVSSSADSGAPIIQMVCWKKQ